MLMPFCVSIVVQNNLDLLGKAKWETLTLDIDIVTSDVFALVNLNFVARILIKIS